MPAPAKVNLFLHVVGRRADGYHLIESLFVLVDLADTLTLDARSTPAAIVRVNDVPGVPAAGDLAVRAARALQRECGRARGVTIGVSTSASRWARGSAAEARTPPPCCSRSIACGASTWHARSSRAIGATLGADVPFFVHGESAFVRGIGEVVRPVSLPRRWLALAMPAVHVPTAAIFASAAN